MYLQLFYIAELFCVKLSNYVNDVGTSAEDQSLMFNKRSQSEIDALFVKSYAEVLLGNVNESEKR